jgi:toxin ParE1/3/4
MRQLVRRPESGRPCDAIRSGYWRASEGRHVIFYVFSKQSLDVIRVLHERMLPERHL